MMSTPRVFEASNAVCEEIDKSINEYRYGLNSKFIDEHSRAVHDLYHQRLREMGMTVYHDGANDIYILVEKEIEGNKREIKVVRVGDSYHISHIGADKELEQFCLFISKTIVDAESKLVAIAEKRLKMIEEEKRITALRVQAIKMKSMLTAIEEGGLDDWESIADIPVDLLVSENPVNAVERKLGIPSRHIVSVDYPIKNRSITEDIISKCAAFNREIGSHAIELVFQNLHATISCDETFIEKSNALVSLINDKVAEQAMIEKTAPIKGPRSRMHKQKRNFVARISNQFQNKLMDVPKSVEKQKLHDIVSNIYYHSNDLS